MKEASNAFFGSVAKLRSWAEYVFQVTERRDAIVVQSIVCDRTGQITVSIITKSFKLPKKLDHLLELLRSPYSHIYSIFSEMPEEKRELVQELFSNRSLREKTLEISLAVPFSEVALCVENISGEPSRKNARTWDRLTEFIFNFASIATSTHYPRSQT